MKSLRIICVKVQTLILFRFYDTSFEEKIKSKKMIVIMNEKQEILKRKEQIIDANRHTLYQLQTDAREKDMSARAAL